MSKEQTPIDEYQELRYIGLTHDHVSEVLEWHKSKVLEALERVEEKLYQEKYNPTGHYLFDVIEIQNIIEEVKPKYKVK